MAKLDFLQAQFGQQIKDVLAKDQTAGHAFGYDIEAAETGTIFLDFANKTDPTQDRTANPYRYLHWICRSVCQAAAEDKPILAEDLYKLHNDLRDFDSWTAKFAADGVPNQIGSYESYDALQNALRPYQQKRDAKKAEQERRQIREEEKQKIMAETTVVYEGEEGKVVIPHTSSSCQYWGEQTRWCIAARSNNFFESYNAAQPVLIYLPKPEEDDKTTYPEYKSFKFAAVGADVFNELDYTRLSFYPACLHKLAAAALDTLQGASLDFFKTHGRAEDILAKPSDRPPESAMVNQPRFRLLHDTATEPEYACILQNLSFYFEGSESCKDEGKEALKDRPDLLADRNFILYAVKEGRRTHWLRDLPDEYRDDEEIVSETINNDSLCLKHASESLRGDRDFVLKHMNEYVYGDATEEIHADRELAMIAVQQNGTALQHVFPSYNRYENALKDKFRIVASKLLSGHPDLHDDRELVETAVRNKSMALKYASPRLRNERDICMLAGVRRYEDFGPQIRADEDIIREAVKSDYRNFEYVPRHLRHDRDFVLEMLELSPHILQFTPKKFTKDRSFMLEAVQKNGTALAYATKQNFFSFEYLFNDDREIVMAAVTSNGKALEYVDRELRRDREICLAAVASNGEALQYVPRKFYDDEEIVRTAMKSDLSACKYLDPNYRPPVIGLDKPFSHKLLGDKEFVLEAIRIDPRNLAYAAESLRADYDINRTAVLESVEVIDFVHPDFLKDPAFMSDILSVYRERGEETEKLAPCLRHMPPLWGELENFCEIGKAIDILKDLPPAPPQPPLSPLRGMFTIM